ncbi:PREDICTED: putative late blight resistance protein homolog R1A-3 [Nicotiana attenuata]|uniref:putative late blight resistance protein homolog R1A-3 n=1 Tax=Nicotiana attenuata TaxID=49451 RepID=UPI000904C2F6|nr:PREDICTED: putative late blight resistance protein homolog R1A-3 [Nicotiana attenuata]
MDRGNENEGERKKGEGNNFSVSSYVIREDIFNLLDFIERLKNEEDQIDVDMDRIEKLKLELTYVSTFPLLSYSKLDSFNAKMSRKAERVFSLVQSVFYESGKHMLVKYDMDHVVHRLLENIDRYISSLGHPESSSTMIEEKLVELLDSLVINLRDLPNPCAELILPLMTQYDVVQHVCGNIRDFHGLKVNGCIEHEIVDYVLPQFQLMAERVGHFCSVLLAYQLDKIDELDDKLEVPQVISMLAHLLVEIIPVELEIMHICSTNFERSKSAEVGRLVKQLLETSPNILREYLIHLQAHMVTVLGASASARNIHVMIEFLLIILTDLSKDFIRQEKLFVLLARVGALTREVSILVRDLEEKSRSEENTDEIKCATLDLLENIELLKEELKHIYLKAPEDSSQHCFSKSDGPLFMNLLLRNLSDLFDSNAYSVALIKKEIGCVKEDLEFIRSFFGNVEQDLNRDLWTRVLDVAYEAEHAINSILARDHGLLQLIFLLPDTVEKIKHIKEEVLEKIPKNTGIVVVNSPKKPVESKSSIANKIIVGFEEEKEWIIRKLTSGPADVDVISIVGMPGLGKTTLADRVYNDKTVVDHFDVRAWCTIDQERNEKKLLQKIFNQVIGLKDTFSEDHIDDDVADKLRKLLFGMRYLIVLDDLWDTATWDELTRPFPEFQKRSRIILTSRKKEVALQGKHHRDPLYLRLLTLGESWELLEKRVFGEERCPDELLDVGEEIARKCDGLPLVLDLIGGVIARKEKTKTFWLEVLKNLNSFIFKDEEEVMKVIQLSYDHLSDHLKPCLIYLASYPKDERILISDLTDLWSAEGLVEQTGMEVYVEELISSSLVIVPNERGAYLSCQIHDLVHDFCLKKARKEKLFDFISSSATSSSSSFSSSSSSSDLMPRAMTIHYDQHFLHADENFVLFNAEKENPYVKHLLSLKVYINDNGEYGKRYYLSSNCHLRHLRLLKRLELLQIILTDSLLNDICMLVHLRWLNIRMDARALPPPFSNLLNLETLLVDNRGSNMVLSPSIWSLAKLRHVDVYTCSFFDLFTDEPTVLEEDSKLENLRILHSLNLPYSNEDTFKRFPNLRSLKFSIREPWDCSSERISFPRLDLLNELEEVYAQFHRFPFSKHEPEDQYCDFHFPLSLKELELTNFNLTSDSLSKIARLPNLQDLCLRIAIIQGKEWNMEEWNTEDVTFENLKVLTLYKVSFSEWQVGEESYPVLEKLYILNCHDLMEIPECFGDIASLKSITVLGNPQLKESALKVKEYVADMTGEDKLAVM